MKDFPSDNQNTQFQECQLCYELVEQYRMACICFCDHEFCELCLIECIEQKLKNFETIVCPAEGCEGKLDTDCGLMVSLTESEKKKYRQIKFRKFAEQNNWILCPNEHCEEGTLKKHSTKRKGKCGKCKTIYCLKCMLPKHKGACQNMEETLLKHKFDFKKCPNCQRLVERNQGCRHMTCKCKSEFCYDCGGAWSRNHVCVVKEKINLEDFKQSEKQSEFEQESEQQKEQNTDQQIKFPEPTYVNGKIDVLLRKNCFFFVNKRFRRLSRCRKVKWLILTFMYYFVFGFLLVLWSHFCMIITVLYFLAILVFSCLKGPFTICKLFVKSTMSTNLLVFSIFMSAVFFPITWLILSIYYFCQNFPSNFSKLVFFVQRGQFRQRINIEIIYSCERRQQRHERRQQRQAERRREQELQLQHQLQQRRRQNQRYREIERRANQLRQRQCKKLQMKQRLRERNRQTQTTKRKREEEEKKRKKIEDKKQRRKRQRERKIKQWFYDEEEEEKGKEFTKKEKQEEEIRENVLRMIRKEQNSIVTLKVEEFDMIQTYLQ